MRTFLNNMELYLTAAGIAVTVLLPSIGGWQGSAWWQVAAITATLVGLIHGMLFWVVRRRQRQVRATIIAELRAMLKDRVNNQMMTLLGEVTLQTGASDDGMVEETIHLHAQHIQKLLNGLSEETLRAWQQRYPSAAVAPRPPRLGSGTSDV